MRGKKIWKGNQEKGGKEKKRREKIAKRKKKREMEIRGKEGKK